MSAYQTISFWGLTQALNVSAARLHPLVPMLKAIHELSTANSTAAELARSCYLTLSCELEAIDDMCERADNTEFDMAKAGEAQHG